MKIIIPERPGAPKTHLYVNVIAKDNNLGQRPIVFILPGGPGMDSSVYKAYQCLVDVADIVFHDPRGCGKSDINDPASYTMDNYIDDLETIRSHFGFEKIIILGKSYGSTCALGYAVRYQAKTAKLILAAGAPSYRFLDLAKRNLARVGTPVQIQQAEKLWQGSFQNKEEFVEFFRSTASLYSMKAKIKPDVFTLANHSDGISYESCNLGFRTFLRKFDFEPELKNINCPTLILAGQEDWINDVEIAKLMAAKIPHNQLKIFANSGHSMESDVPDQYFAEIRKFIIDEGISHDSNFVSS